MIICFDVGMDASTTEKFHLELIESSLGYLILALFPQIKLQLRPAWLIDQHSALIFRGSLYSRKNTNFFQNVLKTDQNFGKNSEY